MDSCSSTFEMFINYIYNYSKILGCLIDKDSLGPLALLFQQSRALASEWLKLKLFATYANITIVLN